MVHFEASLPFLMTKRLPSLLSTLILSVALAVPGSLVAADDAEESPLHQGMEAMGKAMRAINNGLKAEDPATAQAELLTALQGMQEHAVAGKAMIPASIAKLPEAEQPAKLAAYRADLAAAIVVMLELERAVIAQDWDKAREYFGQMRSARKDGHEKYNPDEG